MKSISTKLFIITSLVFISFITLTMLLQSMFIGTFYLNKKTLDFNKNFNKYAVIINRGNSTKDVQSKASQDFEIQNNAITAMVDFSSGIKFYSTTPKRQINLPNGSVKLMIDNTKMGLLSSAFNTWLTNSNYLHDVMNNEKNLTFTVEDKRNHVKSIVGITPILDGSSVNSVIIAVASLQPIGEASSVIKQFYIYFYAIAIVLILILSLIYSNLISKPLITLNKAALKMAELDFSTKCTIKSEDEIGSLSNSLNFLSEKLDMSLMELKTANEKLKLDIENEKKLEKMRKEFVAGVSHELKTPITLIGGYAEAIKDNISDGSRRDYYSDVIIDESQKMSMLVNDMLDLSQLESGNFKLNTEDFYIDELLESIIKKYSYSMKADSPKFSLNIESKNAEIHGDWFRLEQVITNLLNNSIKFTPVGKVIKITESVNENKVLIEIENPGEHIPADELNNVWEKFYKIEKSRSREYGGTGIGLSVVKNILDLHGGTYGVVNTDYGVKFYFNLTILDTLE
jgi:two-component system, OmpR family, sensor histidine kinase VanS